MESNHLSPFSPQAFFPQVLFPSYFLRFLLNATAKIWKRTWGKDWWGKRVGEKDAKGG